MRSILLGEIKLIRHWFTYHDIVPALQGLPLLLCQLWLLGLLLVYLDWWIYWFWAREGYVSGLLTVMRYV
jgi:hypothetical protein